MPHNKLDEILGHKTNIKALRAEEEKARLNRMQGNITDDEAARSTEWEELPYPKRRPGEYYHGLFAEDPEGNITDDEAARLVEEARSRDTYPLKDRRDNPEEPLDSGRGIDDPSYQSGDAFPGEELAQDEAFAPSPPPQGVLPVPPMSGALIPPQSVLPVPPMSGALIPPQDAAQMPMQGVPQMQPQSVLPVPPMGGALMPPQGVPQMPLPRSLMPPQGVPPMPLQGTPQMPMVDPPTFDQRFNALQGQNQNDYRDELARRVSEKYFRDRVLRR